MPAISDDDRFALSAVGSGQHGVKELRIGFVAANLLADEYLVNVRRYAAFVQFGRLHFGPSVGNNIDFEVGLQLRKHIESALNACSFALNQRHKFVVQSQHLLRSDGLSCQVKGVRQSGNGEGLLINHAGSVQMPEMVAVGHIERKVRLKGAEEGAPSVLLVKDAERMLVVVVRIPKGIVEIDEKLLGVDHFR